MTAPAPRVPWHRRLSLRLAALVAAALVAFELGGPRLEERVFALFGSPDTSGGFYVLDGSWVEDALLYGAVEEAPGRWRPLRRESLALARDLRAEGSAFVWLGADRTVVDFSRGLPFAPGEPWPAEIAPAGEVALPGEPPRTVRAAAVRVLRDEALLGTFVSLEIDREAHARYHRVPLEELDDVADCEYAPYDAPVYASELSLIHI